MLFTLFFPPLPSMNLCTTVSWKWKTASHIQHISNSSSTLHARLPQHPPVKAQILLLLLQIQARWWNQTGSGTHMSLTQISARERRGMIQNEEWGNNQPTNQKPPPTKKKTRKKVLPGGRGKAQSFPCLRTYVTSTGAPSCRKYQTHSACLMLLWEDASFLRILN